MHQYLADFKDQLLFFIYAENPEEIVKNFEFYSNLDPFMAEDGIATKYASFEQYEALLDPFLESEDKLFFWEKY